ncbi:MAG: hypothetical protein JNK82_21200, partial [Myxococcaceae bacterium]|nr:hypothetical protein [Myxococcaceae bacterium]
PSTSDFGEGNGTFDLTTGRKKLYARDARSQLKGLLPAQLERINLLLDGGIRDLFNFGVMSHQVFGLLKTLKPEGTKSFRDWAEIPGMKDPRSGSYRPWGGPWGRAPKSFEVLYGKETPTQEDRELGDGDHVGTNSQAVNRIATLYNWVAAQWPSLPRPSTPLGQGKPYGERETVEWFDSAALGAKRGYGVFLPPGYDLEENAETRYPVLYLLHGYTGEPRQILPSAFLADTFMKDTDVKLRPMIVIVPSGACCFVQRATGARDCREEDDSGASYVFKADWSRECVGGSFFAGKYEDSLLELMNIVDVKYRTLPAEEVTAR